VIFLLQSIKSSNGRGERIEFMKEKFRKVLDGLYKHWKDVDGQDLVEYALLLIFVGLAAVASLKSLSTAIKSTMTNANTELLVAGGISTSAAGADVTVAQNTGSAAADTAAEGVNTADSAAEAQAARATNNIAAQTDLNAASLALSNIGFTLGPLGVIGGAAFDDAQAAAAAAAGNIALAARDAAAANADVQAAAQDEAAATSKGTIFGI
jgi:Flp pilus assembly pilin Flp